MKTKTPKEVKRTYFTFTLSMTFQGHNTISKQKDPVDPPNPLSLSLSDKIESERQIQKLQNQTQYEEKGYLYKFEYLTVSQVNKPKDGSSCVTAKKVKDFLDPLTFSLCGICGREKDRDKIHKKIVEFL